MYKKGTGRAVWVEWIKLAHRVRSIPRALCFWHPKRWSHGPALPKKRREQGQDTPLQHKTNGDREGEGTNGEDERPR